jgi:hypothetical protein
LKYHNDSHYRSTFGGIISIGVVMGITAFFCVLISRCIDNESYTVTSNFSTINQALDLSRSLTLDKSNFDISLYVEYTGSREELKDYENID